MMAEKSRVGNFHQWIVHLEVEHLTDAPLSQPVEQARLGQGKERAAVAVGAEEQVARRLQQELSRCQVEGRYGALLEEEDISRGKAEITMIAEKGLRFLAVAGTGHDEERNRAAKAPPQGEHLFGVDLKQAFVG